LQKFQQRDKKVGEEKSDLDKAIDTFRRNVNSPYDGFIAIYGFENTSDVLLYRRDLNFRLMVISDLDVTINSEIPFQKDKSQIYIIPYGREKEFIEKSRLALEEGYTPENENVISCISTLTELAGKLGVN
jgi:hypothetical protein